MAYKNAFPDMCDRYGRPLYWRHFQYASSWLGREALRAQLLQAQAARMAIDAKGYMEWQRAALRVVQPGD